MAKRVFGSNRHIGGAQQGVGAGSEHPQDATILDVVGKTYPHPVALADPVLLHGPHLLRPVAEQVQIRQ